MTTERDIDVTIQRRRFHKLRGIPRWRIELSLYRGVRQSAEADTVISAWDGAVAGARLIAGVTVTSECPFDRKGRLR